MKKNTSFKYSGPELKALRFTSLMTPEGLRHLYKGLFRHNATAASLSYETHYKTNGLHCVTSASHCASDDCAQPSSKHSSNCVMSESPNDISSLKEVIVTPSPSTTAIQAS